MLIGLVAVPIAVNEPVVSTSSPAPGHITITVPGSIVKAASIEMIPQTEMFPDQVVGTVTLSVIVEEPPPVPELS